MSTEEDFITQCNAIICNEDDYEKYVRENMSDFVQFYDSSWKDLFSAVININRELNLNKFAEEGKLIELKIAKKIGKEITSNLANIALFNMQLPVLFWLKENNILVSLPFEIELVREPNFRLLKFLDKNC